MKRVMILIKTIGMVDDDFDTAQLEDCLYNNVMLDIDGFEAEDAEFLVKEIEDDE